MNSNKLLTVSAVFGLLLAGCSGSDTVPSGSSAEDTDFVRFEDNVFGNDAQTTGVGGRSTGDFIVYDGMPPGDEQLLQNLVIYFEFDSSEIRSDFNDMLAAHSRYLAAVPDATVRLEGHADERGSREYNIGLGERRAQAVRQLLLLGGASPAQLTTISYGEERPAEFGSDDEAYSLNRRVELVYR